MLEYRAASDLRNVGEENQTFSLSTGDLPTARDRLYTKLRWEA